MNLILLETAENEVRLPRADPRAVHLLEVLRRRVGEACDVGVVDGPQGRGTVTAIDDEALTLHLAWNPAPPPPLDPITLLVGLPRPQTARKILAETAALGVGALHFVGARKGEPSYADSTLWRSGEWRRHLVAGAGQAFSTRVPEVTFGRSLEEVLAGTIAGTRLALDNYASSGRLSAAAVAGAALLALGPERGWADEERALLRRNGFLLVDLGPRILRVETACVAAVALVKAKLGCG